ncbi:transposase [Streptomyces sp. NPDC051569]|uniref:transposase n=1 Tax=Streptomyces sp. NPDC051569 TaxID=3365661 RepID=UPI00378B25A7
MPHRASTPRPAQAGDLDLAIPKLRTGSLSPSLLERRRRIDQALYTMIMETYVHGCPLAAWTTCSRRWAGRHHRGPADAKSSDSWSATARPMRSGPSFCAPCVNAS